MSGYDYEPEPEWLTRSTNTEAYETLRTREDYLAAAARLHPVDVVVPAIGPHEAHNLRLGELTEMTLLWGRAGVGKTWVAMWMAARLAAQNIRSYMLVTEGLPAYLRRLPAQDWPNGLIPWTKRVSRSDIKGANHNGILEDAQQCGAIFLDVVSALFSDFDENSSSAWNTTRELLNPIIGDRLFVAVHHSGKAGNNPSTRYPDTPRGTSRLIDDAAYDYVIAHGGQPHTAKMRAGTKSRGADEPYDSELFFRFTPNGPTVYDIQES